MVTVMAPGPESEGSARGTSAMSAPWPFLSVGLSPNCSPRRSISNPTAPRSIPPAIRNAGILIPR